MQTNQKSILSKFIFLFTIVALSCKPELMELKPVIIQQNNDLTVAEAQEWFQNNDKELNSIAEKPIGKVVLWNEAKEIKLSDNKSYILVDANYTNSSNRVSSIINEEDGSEKWKKADKEIKKNRKDYSTILKLLVYKNGDGILEKKLLKIIPTEEYRNNSKKKEIFLTDFTGYITANDWEKENLIDGESIVNGKLIGTLSFISSRTVKGAKMNNSQSCTVTTISTRTQIPCSGPNGPGGPQQKISSEVNPGGECFEWQYSSTVSCYTGGNQGGNVSSYFNIINQGSGGSGYAGTESNSNFVSRWYGSMQNSFNVSFSSQELEYLNNNLEMISMIEDAIRNLPNRPNYLSLRDLASMTLSLKSNVGKHQMSLFDQLLYPRFTEVVKNLQSFVQNDTQVMNALLLYSGYSSSEILSKLAFGSGPNIAILPLNNAYGAFNRVENPNLVKIDSYWVQQLEQAYSLGKKQAIGFLLAVTSLHEFVHQSRHLNGLTADYEYGVGFENAAFGLSIDDINASSYAFRFYRKN